MTIVSGDILCERDGAIATVTLSNPDKRNAMTSGMWRKLGTVFTELGADESIRCIVLRGAGNDAFAAGADISTFKQDRNDVASARAFGEMAHASMLAIETCPHPIVALIKGVCVGGGLEIAALCDIRICGASARFGIPVKNLGLVVSLTELPGLIRIAGVPATLEILLEGRVFGAEEAERKGLVNRIVPDDQVEAEAYKSAARIAEGAPLVARWHKKFVRRLTPTPDLSAAEHEESYACFSTQDYQIGYQAFLEKKKPTFVGR